MWWLFAGTAVIGSAFAWVARARRARLDVPPDGARGSAIADLSEGRFRISGRVVVAHETSDSRIDGLPCVFIERAEYEPVGSALVPLMREVERAMRCHPFYVEDGTGRVLVDPAVVAIDAPTVSEDEGFIVERRLRTDEEVEVVGTFRMAPDEREGGPYRGSCHVFVPVPDAVGPPQLTYRTVRGMERSSDEVGVFFRSVGATFWVVSLVSLVIALWG